MKKVDYTTNNQHMSEITVKHLYNRFIDTLLRLKEVRPNIRVHAVNELYEKPEVPEVGINVFILYTPDTLDETFYNLTNGCVSIKMEILSKAENFTDGEPETSFNSYLDTTYAIKDFMTSRGYEMESCPYGYPGCVVRIAELK